LFVGAVAGFAAVAFAVAAEDEKRVNQNELGGRPEKKVEK
jgi:hypothetical protein